MVSRKIVTTITAGLMTVGLAAPAMAAMTTDYVGGGTWRHGTEDGKVKSNFYHGGRYHGSSVTYGSGNTRVYSGCTRPGAWSYASGPDTMWIDEAYYSFCD